MDESPELSVLIHELGGMLSSVQGFAHIAAENPDHPERERFIKLAASEARRAAQTVKDVHLVRSFDRGRINPSPPPVGLAAVLANAARQSSGAGLQLVGGRDAMVTVDPSKIASLLGRCMDAAIAPAAVVTSAGRADVTVPIAPAEQLGRRTEALEAPYPDMVVWSILRRLLRYWGGDVTLAAEGGSTVARLSFPRA